MTDTTIAGEGPASTAGPRSDASRVRRLPQRAAYDDATIHAVLDAALIGHVGFVAGDRPFVIPMLYGRDGSTDRTSTAPWPAASCARWPTGSTCA